MNYQLIKKCLEILNEQINEAEPTSRELEELRQYLIHHVAIIEMRQVYKNAVGV